MHRHKPWRRPRRADMRRRALLPLPPPRRARHWLDRHEAERDDLDRMLAELMAREDDQDRVKRS